MKTTFITTFFIFCAATIFAQTQDNNELETLLSQDKKPEKEYAMNAFKSTRVINGQSMEMLGKGVLDFRILHRFGTFKSGIDNFFGLDQATMRLGFDYGISKDFTLGVGRSTFNKEYDGYFKYRFMHQHKGLKPMPISLIWVSGITLTSAKFSNSQLNDFSNRLNYFHQIIAGRKINEQISVQLSPTFVHRNLVNTPYDFNNTIALGIGARFKISKRSAFIVDTYPILYGATQYYNFFPISLGIDIETGGHVFQLHITNASGMNEKSFITETTQDWAKGQIQFGFNLSRVFTVVKNKTMSY